MVCRLCGAANAPQHASCGACGLPLEQAPVTRGARRHAAARSGWLVWLAVCLVLGAALGYALVRLALPAEPGSDLRRAGMILGAVAGGPLGLLPGPASKHLRIAKANALAAFYRWACSRKCGRLRRHYEGALESGFVDPDLSARLAAVLWLEGHRDRAEQIAGRAVQGGEDHAVARHNYAVAQAVAGRHARAIEELELAKHGLSRSATLHWNLGLARWAQGQLAGAGDAFRAAADCGGDSLLPEMSLALVRARLGELAAARSDLERLLSRSRRHPGVLCNLGVIQHSLGMPDIAEGYFTAALHSDATHTAARYNRGVCAIIEGRYHAAVEDFLALSRVEDHAWATIQRAICHYRLGQRARALEALRRAVRLGPGDFQVRYNAGTVLLREGVIERSVSELEKAYELDPRNIDIILNLGVAMYLSGHLRPAADHFRAAVRMGPQHALARYNCAVVNSMSDRLEEAEKEVEELVQLYPDFPDAYNAIGVIRLLQNRLVEAAEQFRRVADMMPRSAIARSNLALTYYMEGDLSAAREQASFALGVDPEMAAARDIAGHVALELDDKATAIEHFRLLARLEPSNPDVHSNLGLAYYKDDRLGDSIEAYKRVLIFSPNSPEGHNDLGLAYAKDKRLQEAATHLKQVIQWRPGNPALHSNLGLVLYFKNDTEDAVHEWREVTRLSPRYARLREATRFSAYDDQEMYIRPMAPKVRASHLPLKIAAFRHTLQLAFDERAYRLEIPWPDIAACARWQEKAKAAKRATRRP